ncbi:MAG: lysophospholipid acyltransferase family protein [Terracidiphilus sp.]|jgi:1-acyl-sn-glycerol-3-phosphate acyltransferase
MTLERRAQWGRDAGRQILPALGIRFKAIGKIPERGLLVSNHLSYLDILIYGTVLPCFFVSKAEISRWPFFGWMSRTGGTIYLERSSRASAEKVSKEIRERLDLPAMVVLFPEGTSTDGSKLLRFRSRLFAPAIDTGAPVTAAAIRYVPDDGAPERELCWYGDETFLPHLWTALGGAGFTAEVHFGEPRIYTDRRIAAEATHAEVVEMRSGNRPTVQPDVQVAAIVK